jgi:hypothetical protein
MSLYLYLGKYTYVSRDFTINNSGGSAMEGLTHASLKKEKLARFLPA